MRPGFRRNRLRWSHREQDQGVQLSGMRGEMFNVTPIPWVGGQVEVHPPGVTL